MGGWDFHNDGNGWVLLLDLMCHPGWVGACDRDGSCPSGYGGPLLTTLHLCSPKFSNGRRCFA